MRVLKLCLALGLVLAVSGTAGAITFSHDWSGPIAWDLTNRESGTIYVNPNTGVPYANGVYGPAIVDPAYVGPLPAGIPAPGAIGQEDGWGIFRINTILEASVSVPHVKITEDDTAILWKDGDNQKELIGIFWGIQDIGFEQYGSAVAPTQTIESQGFYYEVWEQDYGQFDLLAGGGALAGFRQGSAGRDLLIANMYNGIGALGGASGASLWLSGVGAPGFQGPRYGGLALTDTVFQGVFAPKAQPGSSSGQAEVWLNATGGTVGSPVPSYPTVDSDWYIGTTDPVTGLPYAPLGPAVADIRAFFNTTSNNPTNTVGGGTIEGDWTVTSTDITAGIYVVPEPATMLAAAMGIGALGGYLRRRRRA